MQWSSANVTLVSDTILSVSSSNKSPHVKPFLSICSTSTSTSISYIRQSSHLPLQHVFGTDIGDVSNMTPTQIYEHSMRGIAQLQMKLTDLPLGVLGGQQKGTGAGAGDDGRVGRPNMFMLSHSHFVNYGGTWHVSSEYSAKYSSECCAFVQVAMTALFCYSNSSLIACWLNGVTSHGAKWDAVQHFVTQVLRSLLLSSLALQLLLASTLL